MAEDQSLDEFAGAADADRDDGHGDRSDADTAPESGEQSETDAEPVTATATWTADGADCDRCGEPISRRWRDGDALVCADCKDWSG